MNAFKLKWYFSSRLLSYLLTPPLRQEMTQGQFLSGVQQVWIQSFPSPRLVASPRLKNPSLPYYLPIAGGRIIGFIPFPRVLVLCEMQSVSSRIWAPVVVSISYDNNRYTTGWFIYVYIYIYSHPQTDCFVLSEHFSVARQVGRS